MSLIPKGANRGKVLVWNILPVLAKVPPAFDQNLPANLWWAFQAYAIVDPAVNPTGPRFQNFLLPIERVDPLAASGAMSNPPASDLFCSGHAWTQFGDLVVVGGTTFVVAGGLFAPLMTYVFNPAEATARFPGHPSSPPPPPGPLYGAGPQGFWVRGPDMTFKRWYATATLTSRLARLANAANPLGREAMLVLGGSGQVPGSPLNSPGWNSYEAFVVDAPCTASPIAPALPHGLDRDSTGTPPTQVFTWIGPGTVPLPGPTAYEEDWLLEYPRAHWQSGHLAFFSGYPPQAARLDHESPGTWTREDALYSSNWPHLRHDGSSVLLAKVGAFQDVVLRIGGATESHFSPSSQTTATAEMSFASGPWWPVASMPATDGALNGGRHSSNAIVLPTGAVLVLGGENLTGTTNQAMVSPLIYALGVWHVDLPNAVLSNRKYHSTAVLLPDGRVMIGGGGTRVYDYEIYSPYYLQLPASHKPVNLAFQAPLPVFNSTYLAHELHYGSQYVIHCNPIAAPNVAVQRAVLISPGSTTHSSDMHQRFVELTATVTGANQVQFTVPAEDFAPRGLYMLWLVTNSGAVSDAVWVVLP